MSIKKSPFLSIQTKHYKTLLGNPCIILEVKWFEEPEY